MPQNDGWLGCPFPHLSRLATLTRGPLTPGIVEE